MDVKEYALRGIRTELQLALNTEQACREGLRKIQGLELGNIYGIIRDLSFHLYEPFHIIAQLKELGRDRALFHVLAVEDCKKNLEFQAMLLANSPMMSLFWGSKWEATPVPLKDLSLYVGWQVKTKLYEKLLKGA